MTYGFDRRGMLLLVASVTLAHAALIALVPEPKPNQASARLPLEVALQQPANPARPAPTHSQPTIAEHVQPVSTTATAKIIGPAPAKPVQEAALPVHPVATGPAAPELAAVSPALPAWQKSDSPGFPTLPPRYQAAHLDNPAPDYPPLARRRGWQGTVKLKVRVLDNGKPEEIRVQTGSGFASLDEAAIDAVRRWRFIPAQRGNVAVDEWVLVPVEFRLHDE